MRLTALVLLTAAACISQGTDVPPITAGSGVTVDKATNTVSVDPAQVPVLPACSKGQVVVRGADAWACSDATAASNADTLDGKHAADFLGATAQAADSAALGGRPPADFLSVDGSGSYPAAGDVALGSSYRVSISYRPRLCIVGRVCGGAISVSGRYCGQTAAVTGALTWSGDGLTASGYMAGKKLCEAVAGCSSDGNLAHMCSAEELSRSMQIGIGFPGPVWYSPGFIYDCNGWSDGTAGQYGWTWSPFGARTCDQAAPIACCL